MRRPVYGFGLAFCLACLAGAFVPLPALWLAAAFSACLFAVLTPVSYTHLTLPTIA